MAKAKKRATNKMGKRKATSKKSRIEDVLARLPPTAIPMMLKREYDKLSPTDKKAVKVAAIKAGTKLALLL